MSIYYNTDTPSNKQAEFKPTWLYVKQHKITGLKYFGKTVKKDPIKYKGSGKYWNSHIIKYGEDNVVTLWCHLYTSKEELTDDAISFSIYHNIVLSDEWANLVPENGLWGSGGVVGVKRTKETCERIGAKSRGRKWPEQSKKNFKKPKSPEHTQKLAKIRKGKLWWNNGELCTMSRIQPGIEWVRGRLKK